MNEHIDGGELRAPESLETFKAWPLDKKIIVASLVVVILTFGGCVAASVSEIAALRPKKIVLTDGVSRSVLAATPKPKVHPSEFLPAKILEFSVLNLQAVPGA